jgi:hypothetical protein
MAQALTDRTITVTLPRLHPGQRIVRDSPARFRCVTAGRRWGKTLLGVSLCVEAAAKGGRAWWIAPTFPIASIGWRAIRHLVKQIPYSEVREGERIATLPGGGWIQVKSSDNPDSLRGEGLDLAVFDECAFMVEEAWVEAVRPALSDRQGKALFISTPQGRNWFWRMWARGQSGDAEWASWTFPTADNPYIDPLEIEAARLGSPPRVFAQEYEADFSLSEGVFFPEWNESKHVIGVRDIPKDWVRWVSVDWGFADPFAALWFARDPETRRVFVYRELYERGLREEQQARLILQHNGEERIAQYIADPSMWNARTESNRPSIASIYRETGVPIVPAGNSRVSGWQIVRNALAGDPPRVQVMGNCRNLIRTMPEMVHDPIDVEDLAVKIKGQGIDEHTEDCFRYGLVAEAQPVQTFRLSDFRVVA